MFRESKLALDGGKPVRNQYLAYSRQWIDEKDIQSVIKTLKGDYITTGPAISLFERKIAEYVKARFAVSFTSGTAALHGACYAAGITKGDEVITTPMTFAASANCVLYREGTVVFADINPYTYNIEPENIKNLLNKRTKAIIPVHFTGQPVDLGAIHRIAEENNLLVIEDGAHALGAEYQGRKIGGLSTMTVFSFHPVKHITTGEGGIVTTNDESIYEKLLMFRNHGITRDKNKLRNRTEDWYYEMQDLGYNYRLTDIQATLGISQLEKLNKFVALRKEYARMYTDALQNIPEVITPYQKEGCNSSWHLYILRLKLSRLAVNRNKIFQALRKENIGVNVHYIPVYLHPYYQELGYQTGLCKEAEDFYGECITLPLFPAMTEADVQDVIQGVEKVITAFRV
ncbi:MAG: UDP-4-amino-4,6-dideoxy-N-acetyl-beta-L-altrosamine transaminase [Peptococcaceae bacterium]